MFLKRIFDFVMALIALLVFSPVLLIAMLLVKVKIGSPVLFRQTRPGLNGRPFNMLKLCTMSNETDENGVLLPDAERLHTFGKLLRSTSIDELPGLVNVLKGNMSLVGPRPLRMEYLPLYTKEQNRRHQVLPGITGWAQVNGRNAISWEDKFTLDVWYVDNWSFWLDIKILFKTVYKVVAREDVSAENEVTMGWFEGSKKE
ncbi:sugar transferase [Paraglaciecola arctica]|uniref:sugar transferase n=1 Tax=Paraglaciecola arctica TaxID=1128911 RepID=UPI001C07D118|nr:sugar transferase [Paraglaciecola arctica]MBU3002441.1 sugar transferase [Paraglaciecola arctica]